MFVRWSAQNVDADDAGRLPGLGDTVIRRFDAPEALDMRFHEVRTKSALNHVPGGTRGLPFEWTINPYRGCTHACSYCVSGDTPVLLADGRSRPIADLGVGDEIYGTVRRGVDRRYVKTTVLAHWSTVKTAHRVTLEDGTELVASGDHRFLSRRGWKHVAGTHHGLTVSDTLLGVGSFADRTVESLMQLEGCAVTSPAGLDVVSIEPLGLDLPMYDITTGTGDFIASGVISHNCFARPTHEYLELDAGRDFEREIVVKVNVPEVLRKELARPSWRGEPIALGTNTDPYQWVEGRYKLMRGIWEAMRDFRNPCSILTKSPLVLRDLDLLKEIAAVTDVSACLSVPTLDEKAWRATEPHTPNPKARLEAVAELNRNGIATGILIAPLMPGINDAPEQVARIVEAATEANATYIGGNTLFLRGAVREIFFEWLREHRPDLVPRYERLYAKGAYLSTADKRKIELEAGAPWARKTYPERTRHRGARPAPPAVAAPRAPRAIQESLF
jgi:DNA repair photolyase